MNISISDVFGGDNITLTIDGQQVTLATQQGQPGQIKVICEDRKTLADNGLDCGEYVIGIGGEGGSTGTTRSNKGHMRGQENVGR